MKTKIKAVVLIFLAHGFIASSIFAQDLNVFKFIGKPINEVITNYGKPAHLDNSDPSMVCAFYKKGNDSMVFVSNESAIFQADAMVLFDTEEGAVTEMNKLLSSALQQNFSADTLSVTNYELNKTGIYINLALGKDPNSLKYEVKVHAEER